MAKTSNCSDFGLSGIEYPGYGLAQPGSPTEESIYAAAQVMLDHLINELKVDKSSLVMVGQSIGCGAAVEMARRGYGQKLLLLSPFTSLLALSQRIYPVFAPALKIFPFLLNDKFDNLAKAKQVSSETLVIHGDKDEIIPYDMGRELAAKIPGAIFQTAQGRVALRHRWPTELYVTGEIGKCSSKRQASQVSFDMFAMFVAGCFFNRSTPLRFFPKIVSFCDHISSKLFVCKASLQDVDTTTSWTVLKCCH